MFTTEELKTAWVIGSLEKLAGLGYFKEIGYKIDPEFVNFYWEADENRHNLIKSEEIFMIVLELTRESDMSLEHVTEIHKLLMEYKDDRTKVFAYAMENLLINK